MKEDLIDRIYEASFVPELWRGVLDDLAGIAHAEGGLLFTVRDRVLNWTASDSLEEVFSTYVSAGWFRQCSRKVCLLTKASSGFLGENDYWTPEEHETNPIYAEFFRPRGLGWSAGTGLPLPTGDNIVFSVERSTDQGPVDRHSIAVLNELRPHLARSALVSARMGLKQATGAKDALAMLGLPTVLVDAEGGIVDAEIPLGSDTDISQWCARDRVAFADATAQDIFRQALCDITSGHQGTVQSFPVRNSEGLATVVAHVLPIRRSVHELFSNSFALLLFSPVSSRNVPSAELIRSLFDLTAGEARVARELARGQSVEEIALAGDVSVNTVRSQVRQVMEKTGCTRQGQVVALMGNLSVGTSNE